MCLITVGPIGVLGTVLHIRQSSCIKELVLITIIIVIIRKKEEKKKIGGCKSGPSACQGTFIPQSKVSIRS